MTAPNTHFLITRANHFLKPTALVNLLRFKKIASQPPMGSFEEGPKVDCRGLAEISEVKLVRAVKFLAVTRLQQKIERRGFAAAAQRCFPSSVNFLFKALCVWVGTWARGVVGGKLICNLNIVN